MLFRLAALGAVGAAGYAAYRSLVPERHRRLPAAFSRGEPDGQFRNAGPKATRTKGDRMDRQDEALDETFPASDATAKY